MSSQKYVAQQSEAALIAGCLQSKDWFLEASFSLSPKDLAGSLSRPLFQAMVEMESTDVPLVIDRAVEISRKSAEEFSSYLATCFDSRLHSVGDLSILVRTLKDCSTKRQALDYFDRQAGEDFLSAESPGAGVSKVIDRVESIVADGEVVEDEDEQIRIDCFESLEQSSDTSRLLPTGFYDLDALIFPNRKGKLGTWAARPGHGKSRTMRNLAMSFAKQGEMVRIYSLEVAKDTVLLELAAGLCDLRNDATIAPTDEEVEELLICLQNSEDLRRIKVTDLVEEDAIIRDIQRYHHRYGCTVFFIDYLGLIEGSGSKQEEAQARITRITRRLKKLCNKLKIEIHQMSQVNRSCEARQDKRPICSDLRDSGSVEQDSDFIVFIYDDSQYNPDTMERGVIEYLVRKNRKGRTGVVRLLLDTEKQLLRNIARKSYG